VALRFTIDVVYGLHCGVGIQKLQLHSEWLIVVSLVIDGRVVFFSWIWS
jgi:hypothetical protein